MKQNMKLLCIVSTFYVVLRDFIAPFYILPAERFLAFMSLPFCTCNEIDLFAGIYNIVYRLRCEIEN